MTTAPDTTEFIESLRREGRALADAAGRAGLDAPVPTCPQWQVRDLLRHTGAVHRWAAGIVAEGASEPGDWDESTLPDGPELLGWYRESSTLLADVLTAAPAGVQCWAFLPAPSPLAFWARRQAHEITVHRFDAEAAAGEPRTPVAAAFAADGIDELVAGFHVRPRSRVRTMTPRSLRITAADVPGADWLVRLSAESPVVERGAAGAADCTVSGTADALYAALWNRGAYDGLSVEGDDALVGLWQRTATIN